MGRTGSSFTKQSICALSPSLLINKFGKTFPVKFLEKDFPRKLTEIHRISK